MRRRRWFSLLVGLIVLVAGGVAAHGADPLVVVFREEGCPDCARMQTVLDGILAEHPDLAIAYHEISEPGASDLLWRMSLAYGALATRVPAIFVGDRVIIGAGRAEELTLRETIEGCLAAACPSPMVRAQGFVFPWRDLLIVGAFVGLLVVFLLLQGL